MSRQIVKWRATVDEDGTIASRFPYDIAARDALRSVNLRRPAILWGPRNFSSFRNNNLQILAWHDHGAVVGFVHTRDEGVQVVLQAVLLGLIERCKGL
jgi:hypothetical protein